MPTEMREVLLSVMVVPLTPVGVTTKESSTLDAAVKVKALLVASLRLCERTKLVRFVMLTIVALPEMASPVTLIPTINWLVSATETVVPLSAVEIRVKLLIPLLRNTRGLGETLATFPITKGMPS